MRLSFAVISVIVNGEAIEVPEGSTLADLARLRGAPVGVQAVEVNRRVVPRREHPACVLHDGDRIEVVTLVGGG